VGRREGYGFAAEALAELRRAPGCREGRSRNARAGLSPVHVWFFEAAEREPDDDQVRALADALGVERWLLFWQ
jgi:hypothetical protein